MTGVVIHMIIGLLLFTPIGFIAGYIQHKRELEREQESKQTPSRSPEK
jgi:hypothetical protein